jgi:hypothetical protein
VDVASILIINCGRDYIFHDTQRATLVSMSTFLPASRKAAT